MLLDVIRRSACLVAGVAIIGCSSEATEEPDETGPIALSSEAGALEGTFTLSPHPAAVGINEVHAVVKTSAGEAFAGATLTVEPWMPMHGHGSEEQPMVHDMQDGAYHFMNIEYTMPGAWELRVDVELGEMTDRFVVDVEVK